MTDFLSDSIYGKCRRLGEGQIMKNVGFHAGNLLAEVGPATDVAAFFEAVAKYVEKSDIPGDPNLLTDRLYRRTVPMESLDALEAQIREVQRRFSEIKSAAVPWTSLGVDAKHSTLNLSGDTLASVFDKFFTQFFESVSSVKSFYANWHRYLPLRLGFSDIPEYMNDKKRPLEAYETLSGLPFWLR